MRHEMILYSFGGYLITLLQPKIMHSAT